MSAVLDPPMPIDGRELRSIRTRAAIVDAWLELMSEGDLAPTAKEVADRARIGLRTVFQHFNDMNALHRAACDQFAKRLLQSVVRVSSHLPLRDRIDGVVENRGRLFEAATMLRRACERQEWLSTEIHGFLVEWERATETANMLAFGNELMAMTSDDRDTIGRAVDALLSWSSWNQLRQRRSLSVEQSAAVLRASIAALLG